MAMETLVLGKCGNASTPVELIKGDNYTQKIMMRVPRYFGGVDLAPLAWSVTVENAAGATDEYALSAIRGEDAIEMEWIPGGTATAVPGIVKFKLSGYAQDGSDVLIWQSGTYHIRVKDTFSHTPGSETTAELTEVQKLIIYVDGELNKVIKAGNDAAEAARAANKAADRANSVADGKNEGRITALEQFTTKPGEPYAVTGKLVQLDNFEGMPMNAVTRIEPVQAGSGDPYPAGGGKNLLDIANATKATNSVSDVASDGKITIKGSLPVQWTNAYIGAFNMVSGKAYTISGVLGYGRIGFSTDPSITPGNTANPNISTGSADIINCNHSVATFTANDTKTVYVWYCTDSANNGSNSAFTMGLQIEEGATASSYTPYANIRPISGHTGAKLTRCGKNLFDKDSALLNSWYSYSPTTPDVQSWNGLFASKLISVCPGEVFTLTNYITDTSCALVKYMVSETDTGGLGGIRSGDVITCDGTKQIYTFTIPDRARYIGITGDMANIDKVQLELGSVATEYTPYHGETFSASFGQTVYGGTLDWNTGVLTVEWEKVSGRMTRSTTDSSGKLYMISGVPDSLKQQFNGFAEDDPYVICSALPYKALEYARASTEPCISQYGASVYIGGYIGREAELDAILASDDFQIAYKLATPATIQLTPAQLTALQGMNNIFCDAGETTVSGRKDILWLTSGLIEQIDTLKKAIISLGGNV